MIEKIDNAYAVLLEALTKKHLKLMHLSDEVSRTEEERDKIDIDLEQSTKYLATLDHLTNWLKQ